MSLRLVIVFLLMSSMACTTKTENRFFSKEELEVKLKEKLSDLVLEELRKESEMNSDSVLISFYYRTDKRAKIEALMDFFEKEKGSVQIVELNNLHPLWELNGRSDFVKLAPRSIKKWESEFLKIGFDLDCKLDHWGLMNRKKQ